jgi:hypothetical protein
MLAAWRSGSLPHAVGQGMHLVPPSRVDGVDALGADADLAAEVVGDAVEPAPDRRFLLALRVRLGRRAPPRRARSARAALSASVISHCCRAS